MGEGYLRYDFSHVKLAPMAGSPEFGNMGALWPPGYSILGPHHPEHPVGLTVTVFQSFLLVQWLCLASSLPAL